MNIKDYFDNIKGTGIIATSDGNGKINQAIYATPHFLDNGEIAFIMRDRKTHLNITENPNASYLFIKSGNGYDGIRLLLTKVREEINSDLLFSLRRKDNNTEPNEDLFLVIFKIVDQLPLISKK